MTGKLEEIRDRWAKDGLCSDSAVSYLLRRLDAAERINRLWCKCEYAEASDETIEALKSAIAAWKQAKEEA